MTDHSGAPEPRFGRPALARLVEDTGRFADAIWGRRPSLHHGPDPGDLFCPDAVDELLSVRAVRTPFVRLARDGSTLPDKAFTAPGGVGAAVADQLSDDRVFQHFRDGATIVLQGLHRLWPPLIGFGQQLAADLGHPVQINAYITPPQSRGFSDHYDVHDVFVVQISGEKRWQVRPPVLPVPLRSQPWTQRNTEVKLAAAEPALLEHTMGSGDVLYLPRGFLHAATALGETSIHLTVGVHPWTRHHLAGELTRQSLQTLAAEPSVREALPVGVDLTGNLECVVDGLREQLIDVIRRLPAQDLLTALAGQAQDAQRAEPFRPLAQHRAARQLPDDLPLRPRRHLAQRWSAAGDGKVELISRAGRITLTGQQADTVRDFLAGEGSTVGRLGADTAQLLLQAGLAVPDDRPT